MPKWIAARYSQLKPEHALIGTYLKRIKKPRDLKGAFDYVSKPQLLTRMMEVQLDPCLIR